MQHVPFCPLGKNLIVGKLPTSYFSASGLLFFASASTLVTRHCEEFISAREQYISDRRTYIRLVDEVLCDILVDGLQTLTVTAPGGSECNDSVLLGVLEKTV